MSLTLAEQRSARRANAEELGLPPLPAPCQDLSARLPAPGPQPRLVLLAAPAGYGKTTLMSLWFRALRREPRGIAWLSLAPGCADPHAFRSALAQSLGLARLLRQPPSAGGPPPALDALLRSAAHARPFTLFIDQLHHYPPAALDELLRTLLQALPARCQLVIGSRARPSFGFGAMSMEGSALEVGIDDLRFSDDEARRYLGDRVTDDELEQLQHIAEGWPVALRVCRDLARQPGPAGRAPQALADALRASSRLHAYFDEEVLRPLPAPAREVVLQLSLLDEISVELAECLTESPDTPVILETQRSRGLFIMPLEERPLWFRYHRLFAACLRARRPPQAGTHAQSHHRVAAWLLQRGLHAQALPHIGAIGDANLIARLLIASGGWCLLFRGGATVARILHSLPLAVVRAHPSLELARIYRLVHTGELSQARQCFEDLKTRTQDFSVCADAPELTQADGTVMELLLALYEDRTLGPQALIKAEAGLGTGLTGDAIRSSVIRELLSWSFYHAGSFYKALAIGQESVDLCERVGLPYVQIYAYLSMGLAELAEGHVNRAAGIYTHAESEAVRCFGDGCNQVMAAQILGAEILHARNQVVASRNCTAYWREAVADGDGWVDLYASLYRTLSSSMRVLGDGPAALSVLEQARHMARSRRLWRLDQILQNHQLREACLSGDTEQADRLAAQLQNAHPRSVSVQQQGWRVWYTRLLALARHALGRNDSAGCAQMLEDIDQLVFSGTGNHSLCRLERDLLEARMLFERGSDAYVRPLSRALLQAAEAGLVRPVLDEGPVMLRMLRRYAEGFSLTRAVGTFMQQVQAQVGQDFVMPSAPEAEAPAPIAGSAHTPVAGDMLSKREADVLALICDGLTSKEIARRLAISVNTVLTHRKNLYRKLCATTRSQLITIAREQQVLKPSSVAAPYAREA